MKSRLILCGGCRIEQCKGISESEYDITTLSSWGKDANVNIRVEDVAKVFLRQLSGRFLDLIEIASYVYTTDCLARRDSAWTGDSVEPWSRDFNFVIPVRDIKFWCRQDVLDLLIHVLRFLSDDQYNFQFEEAVFNHPIQSYLEFTEDEDWPFYGVDRVLMFSGGLDSLAGALDTASKGKNLVLVSHRAAPTLSKRQIQLFQALKEFYPKCRMLHIPVWINKDKKLGREYTQRTRSFLFAALGAVVAHGVHANGVRFFENGIVSLNLPVADEVLRARSSRTTHPYFLNQMSELLSLVFEREFTVENPYLFKTKTDVVSIIKDLGASHLIKYTCSCAHIGFFQSKTQWHCGTCSQCIDRRVAILATGTENDDPQDDYVVDVFNGARKEGYEKNIAVDYVRHASELARMSEEEMMMKFNLEISRAVKCFPENRREIAQKLIELHKRHGTIVTNILSQQVSSSAKKLIVGELPDTSMMMCVVGKQHLKSSWARYADRIIYLLQQGLPASCTTHKPENEPHLQELSDGILRANDKVLVREYPFMRWSSSMTKPDWSSEEMNLWVEMKYVRKKSDLRQITEDIAADITKYGDNDRNTVFVIYDPSHLLLDEEEFSRPIVQRKNMKVGFIR